MHTFLLNAGEFMASTALKKFFLRGGQFGSLVMVTFNRKRVVSLRRQRWSI
jgi:hypothetical protein